MYQTKKLKDIYKKDILHLLAHERALQTREQIPLEWQKTLQIKEEAPGSSGNQIGRDSGLTGNSCFQRLQRTETTQLAQTGPVLPTSIFRTCHDACTTDGKQPHGCYADGSIEYKCLQVLKDTGYYYIPGTRTLKGKNIQECYKAIKKKANNLFHIQINLILIPRTTLLENVEQITSVATFKC